MPFDGNAEESGAALVLADRDHGAAERRSQNEGHGAGHQRKAEQYEVIEIVGVGQNVELEQAEIDRLTRETAQAVVAAGQRAPLKSDVIKHLPERDRHHSEIDAAPAYDQGAEDGAAKTAQKHSQNKRKRRPGRRDFQRHPGAVGAEAEIGGMAER